MKIGELIKYRRKVTRNLTLENLAKGICSVSYLSKLENGKIEASEEILLLLSERLEIDSTFLLEYEDEFILSELFEWYELIRNRRIDEAESMKLIFQNDKKQFIVSHELKLYYEIFLQYYYISIDDNQKYSVFMRNISSQIEFLNSKQKYYLYKLIALESSNKNNLDKASTYFEKCMDLQDNVGIKESDLFFSAAIVYSRISELRKSSYYIQEALKIFQKELNFDRILDCIMVIGINHLLLKEYKEAEENFEKLLGMDNLEPRKKARVLHNIGVIHYQKNDLAKSLSFLKESLIYREEESLKISTFYLLADIYFVLKNDYEAKKFFEKGFSLATDSENREYIIKFRILRQRYFSDYKDLEWISFLNEEALPFFKSFGDQDDYINTKNLLGQAYHKNKKYKSASEIYQEIFKKIY